MGVLQRAAQCGIGGSVPRIPRGVLQQVTHKFLDYGLLLWRWPLLNVYVYVESTDLGSVRLGYVQELQAGVIVATQYGLELCGEGVVVRDEKVGDPVRVALAKHG